MSARVVILAGFVHAPLVRPLLGPFAAMTVATLVPVALLLRRRGDAPLTAGAPMELRNPFSLTAAVKFGLLFAAVLVVVALMRRYFPGQGYYVVAALAGLTDVDAITLSMAGLARDGGTDAATATGAIVVAALANTLVKCGIIVATAGAALRARVAVVTVLVFAAGLAAVWLG
jgi:uncharacterized membrane protein (DUF4010 family)